jgi:hypothetical protein
MNGLNNRVDFVSSDILMLRQITGTAINNYDFCEVHNLPLSALPADAKQLGHAPPVSVL